MVKKLKELSNVDIDRTFVSDPSYGGCYSKDQLPPHLDAKFYVLNMQNENAGPGTHWTMLDNRDPKIVQYFDSMGQVPPTIVKKLMNSTRKKKVINKFQLQPMGSVTCGWWAIAAATAFEEGKSMADFIAHFDLQHPAANDSILASLF